MEKLNEDSIRDARNRVTDFLEVAFPGTYEHFMCRRTNEGLMVTITRRESSLLELLIPYGVQFYYCHDKIVFHGETHVHFSKEGVSICTDDFQKFNLLIQREVKCYSSWYEPAK